jgi:hypothetical protein
MVRLSQNHASKSPRNLTDIRYVGNKGVKNVPKIPFNLFWLLLETTRDSFFLRGQAGNKGNKQTKINLETFDIYSKLQLQPLTEVE